MTAALFKIPENTLLTAKSLQDAWSRNEVKIDF